MYDYVVLNNQVVFMRKEGFRIFSVSFEELREIQRKSKSELDDFLEQYGIDSKELFRKMQKVERGL